MMKAVLESPYLLRDITKLSPDHQTYGLEVYHSVVNHFAPKSTHFYFLAMAARYFNLHCIAKAQDNTLLVFPTDSTKCPYSTHFIYQ
jgi:hypothetical protein